MADRSVVVRLKADISDLKSKYDQASQATRDTASKMSKSLSDNSAAWDRVGGAALKAGAVGAGALGLTAKAAIDWESAWTGVLKTVDGTDAEMAALEGSLRNLAKTLPSTHSEIAAVAEAAGQLGVAQKDIVGFTRTMIDLGQATNLTADEAATQIAQISNVMGTMQREGALGVQKFGAALVDLGNKGASTEKDILAMASRIAGAAKVVGMTEADLLAVSNALASVGIEAEAGGTAVSTVLMKMSKAVKTGSDDLHTFAKVAGMSGEQFSRLFDAAPAEAMSAFTKGLNGIKESGGDVFTTLKDVGLSDVRVTTAMLKMAGAGDLLTQSLQDGRTAWEQNIALAAEAEKRYATTESQLKMAKNAVTDAAIEFGAVLAPAIREAAGMVSSFADFLGSLPGPVKDFTVGAGAATVGVALLGGSAIKTATSFLELKSAMDEAGIASKGLTRNIGVAGGAAAAALAATAIFDSLGASIAEAMGVKPTGMEEATTAILKGANAGKDFKVSLDAATSAGGQFQGIIEKVVPIAGLFGGGLDSAKASVENYDKALATLVQSGHADQVTEFLKAQGVSAEQAAKDLPIYSAALQDAANQATLAQSPTTGLAESIDEAADAASRTTAEIDELAAAIEGLGGAAMTADAFEAQFQQSIDELTEAVQKNGQAVSANRTEIDLTTEAGRANSAALQDMVKSTVESTSSLFRQGAAQEEVTAKVQAGRDAFVAAAIQMGLTSAAANDLADRYGLIPDEVATLIATPGMDSAKSGVDDFIRRLSSIPRSVESQIAIKVGNLGTLEYALSLVKQLNAQGGRYAVAGKSTGGGSTINADGNMLNNINGALIRAYAWGGIHAPAIGAQQPQIRAAGGAGILWAEQGAGPWEAFISGHPAKATRSRGIAEDTVNRLGGQILWGRPRAFADGAMLSTSGRGPGRMEMVVTGTLDTPFGPAQVRGVVQQELTTLATAASRDIPRGGY